MPFRHIVFCSDLSAPALRPGPVVRELARAGRARVTLLHVLQVPLAVGVGPTPAAVVPDDPDAAMDKARGALEQQLRALDLTEVATAEVVRGAHVARDVVEYAREKQADLIAIATHGRSGLGRLALGSVAEAILRRSDVPVLCVPRGEG